MISTALILIILLFIFDIVVIYWIIQLKNDYTNFQSSESPICPIYYCDQIINLTNSQPEPGSYCYISTPGSNNPMVAYRYTDSSNSSYDCQKYPISDNVILTDQAY